MNEINIVLKHVLTDTIMRSRLLETPQDLDTLLNESVGKLVRATHAQDALLNEKQVAERWEFLDVVRLRNMRYKNTGPKFIKFGTSRNGRIAYRVSDIEAWIVSHYQMETMVEVKLT